MLASPSQGKRPVYFEWLRVLCPRSLCRFLTAHLTAWICRADRGRVIERKIRVKCNHPNEVCSKRRPNQEPVHDAENSKEQDEIGQEAAPDDELCVPPQI